MTLLEKARRANALLRAQQAAVTETLPLFVSGSVVAAAGDAGGSTILDIGGKNVIASDGNRQLAALVRF